MDLPGKAAWFTVDVIKRLTVWYLRRLSEKKQKPRVLLLCLEGCFSGTPSLSHPLQPTPGDIADDESKLVQRISNKMRS